MLLQLKTSTSFFLCPYDSLLLQYSSKTMNPTIPSKIPDFIMEVEQFSDEQASSQESISNRDGEHTADGVQ
jgi:hypothetical protein